MNVGCASVARVQSLVRRTPVPLRVTRRILGSACFFFFMDMPGREKKVQSCVLNPAKASLFRSLLPSQSYVMLHMRLSAAEQCVLMLVKHCLVESQSICSPW